MKHIISSLGATLMAIIFHVCVNAQNPSLGIGNLYVTITNPGDTTAELEALQYVNDSSTVPERVQMNARISVTGIGQLKNVRLKYGSAPGLGDILDMDLDHVVIDGDDFLRYGNMLFPVLNGKVFVRRLIPASSLANAAHIQVNAWDNGNVATPALSRSNIQ